MSTAESDSLNPTITGRCFHFDLVKGSLIETQDDTVGKFLFADPMTGEITPEPKESNEPCSYKMDDAYYVYVGKYSLKARLFSIKNRKMLMMSTGTDEVAVPISKLLSIVKITRKDSDPNGVTLTFYSSFKKFNLSGCTLDMFVTLTDSLNADNVWEDVYEDDDEDENDDEDEDQDEDDENDDDENGKLNIISFIQKLLFGEVKGEGTN
jgi:hypothetical protein